MYRVLYLLPGVTTVKGSSYQDNNSTQEEGNQERLHKYEQRNSYSGLDRTYRMNPSIENDNATWTKHVK